MHSSPNRALTATGHPPRPELMAIHVAILLPALLLARVDGGSPVEYLTDASRATVRATGVDLLLEPSASTNHVLERWRASVDRARSMGRGEEHGECGCGEQPV